MISCISGSEVKNVVLENDLDSINSFINQCLRYAIKNIKFDENSNIIEEVDEVELD